MKNRQLLLLALTSSFTLACADKGEPAALDKTATPPSASPAASEDQKQVEPAAKPADAPADAAPAEQAPEVAEQEEAPVAGTVAFVVLRIDEPKRSERRLAKTLERGLRGKVTTLPSDAESTAFGLATLANEQAPFPSAWRSYQHVVVLQATSSVDTSDDTKYPGGSRFLGLFRTPHAQPLYLEQGLSLWPYGYEQALPIVNSLMKEANQ